MPHECTDCGRTFGDGSTEMLSGCPDCGGNKFRYRPDASESPSEAPESAEEPPERPDSPADSSVARKVGTAATAVRDLVGDSTPTPAGDPPSSGTSGDSSAVTDPSPSSEPASATSTPTSTDGPETEDAAQASARSEVVSSEELPASPETPGSTDRSPAPDAPTDDRTADRPGLAQLREELNDQFESIKVLEPGQYELNLMELYDREEYIIALQEDGKYTIQMPEHWDDA